MVLVGVLLLSGCSTPTTARVQTLPTLTPLPAPTQVLPTDTPPPPATAMRGSDWPTLVDEIPLGFSFAPALYSQPLALDSTGGRVYVSGTPDQTLVLSAQDLTVQESLDTGGNLALDLVNNRLWVGNPTGVTVYNTKSHSRLAHMTLAPDPDAALRHPFVIPLADELGGHVYAIQDTLYHIHTTGLYATALLTRSYDIRAAMLNVEQGVLYVSINSGIPGANNRNDLWAWDMRTWQLQMMVPGVRDWTIDRLGRHLIVALSSSLTSPGALQVWAGQPPTLIQSLANLSGQLALDEERDRLYVLSDYRLVVLQASTLSMSAELPLPVPCAALALDSRADRLYALSRDGDLLVIQGHGGPPPRALSFRPAQPPALPVTRLFVSPDSTTLFGLWNAFLPQGGTLLISQDSGASWSWPGDGLPEASNITDVAFSPNFAQDRTVFVATQRGLYRSTDGGASWQPASVGFDDLWVLQLAISPGYAREPILFALTLSGDLYRTSDGGQVWVKLARRYTEAPESARACALALSPDFERDRTVFLSVRGTPDQLLLSRDAGHSWSLLAHAVALALHPSPGWARDRMLWGVFEQQGLLRSTDGGQTWRGALRGISTASREDQLALSPTFDRDRTALLLARYSAQLYRTSDSGESWQLIAPAWPFTATALALSAETVWLGTAQGNVLTTTLTALNRSPAALQNPNRLEAIALSPAFEQDRTLFVADKATGVWRSSDRGQTWQETGFPARELGLGRMHLVISPDFGRDHTLFAATGSQLYRSSDDGQTWQTLPIGPGHLFPINALAISPHYAEDHTLMIAGDYRAPTVLRSTNGGNTWQSATTGLPGTGNLNQLTFSPDFAADRGVYVWAESDGLYRSGDGGQTWRRVYQPAGSWLVQSFALSPDFRRDRLMFLGTLKENHNVYRSADGGASWRPVELGLPLELLWASALALSPNFGRDRTIFLGTDRGIYRSTDGGQMWRPVSDLPEVVALAISAGDEGRATLFAVSAREGLYVSTDGGDRWSPVQ